jgi:hypothetical protein
LLDAAPSHFFGPAARAGHAGRALELLKSTGADQVWLPLRIALEAASEKNEELPDPWTPEVHDAARKVYDELYFTQTTLK